MTIMVTGGAGFIGSNFIHSWLGTPATAVLNVDSLTYAGNLQNLAAVPDNARYSFARMDIGDRQGIATLLKENSITAIVNFAAETHVDRSISSPGDFIQSNVVGIFELLEAALCYWSELDAHKRSSFRFLQVSTDEVYGSLGASEPAFTENTRYEPNSPYAASKASADHLVRAYYQTYGLPVLTTNCSNNYGPFQFPEKLIPLCIHNAITGLPIPVYGDGRQIRDWLYVEDHCRAIHEVLRNGTTGTTYNVGGEKGIANIDVVRMICGILDEEMPTADRTSYQAQIKFVTDRPGHDRRYAVNSARIQNELGWKPVESFQSGIRKTVRWYLDNQKWVNGVVSGEYRNWIKSQYGT